MRAGVSIVDPGTTWGIDLDRHPLGTDVTILPGTELHGATGCGPPTPSSGPDSTLTDVVIGEGARVTRTHGSGSRSSAPGPPVGTVHPYLRPGTVLGEEGKIGAFYETKNVTHRPRFQALPIRAMPGTRKSAKTSNIGCGNIIANYDGVSRKHRTVIGSEVPPAPTPFSWRR